jgi:dTDP-4-dehydrorhamnose reductase
MENGRPSMGTLAIVGAGGVLGTKLVEQALATTDDHIAAFAHGASPAVPAPASERVTRRTLDIGDPDAVRTAFEEARPRAVINGAAMTNVDACEDRRDEAWAANALGPRHLAQACVRLGALLLHVSTDYVFPGDERQPGPYLEDAPVRAISHYGWTKLMGERAVAEVCAGHVPWVVARTALVYGFVPGGRANFVSWLIGELRAGRRVKIVNDQYNTPTLADDLAAALLLLLRSGGEGFFHIAGPDLVSRHEWARQIADYYRLDAGLIDMFATADLRQRAQRPLRSGLRTMRADELAGVTMRGVRDGLAALGLT